MKKILALANVLFAIVFTFFAVTITVAFAGFPYPIFYGLAAVALIVLMALVSLFLGRNALPAGVAMIGLQKEIWLKQLMENFYPQSNFLVRSTDMTAFVENNTINLADCGVDPEVIWNNTTYPIPMTERSDSPIAIPLDYADTKNTVIRNARKVESAYDQMEVTLRQHRAALVQACAVKALHAYAPAASVAGKTKVLQATGAVKADGTKALTINDLVDADAFLNSIDASTEGRILTLSLAHKADLAKEDKALYKAFLNWKSGDVLPLLNFQLYQTSITATYTSGGVKKAIGAAAAAADSKATQFWLESEVMRADGDVDMFERLKDPEQRGDIVGFQKRFIAMPIRNKGLGVII